MIKDMFGTDRLKINLHLHTTQSDGHKTPEEAAARRTAFDAEMESAIAQAEAAPSMTAEEIYDGLYAG